MTDGGLGLLSGEVEADKTFIGGKASQHAPPDKRERRITGTGGKDKTAVIQISIGTRRERGHATVVVEPPARVCCKPTVREACRAAGSALYTDALQSLRWLIFQGSMPTKSLTMPRSMWTEEVHTNGLENFWSLFLKRGIAGTYVSVEPFHLFRYLDEQTFRFNNRATPDNPLNDSDRFILALSQVTGKRLTYEHLTGKDRADAASLN